MIVSLFEKILKCCEEIGISKPLNILNSWINIQNKDGRLARHSHPNSVLSGVLFLMLLIISFDKCACNS